MKKNKAYDIALVAIMTAIIVVCKFTLAFLPNIELTSFLIIMFTIHFGAKVFFAIPAFIMIEVLVYGFNIFWVTAYFYTWPILFLLSLFFRRKKDSYFMAALSGLFGLGFGFLCSFPYIFIGSGKGLHEGIKFALSWWIAGIPFDLIHGVSNFIICLVLFKPVSMVLERIVQSKSDS